MDLEERSRRRDQMQGCKSSWAADTQQPGWLEPSMRNLKLRLFDIFEGGFEAVIVGKAGFRRARPARRPAYELDSNVLLDGRQ